MHENTRAMNNMGQLSLRCLDGVRPKKMTPEQKLEHANELRAKTLEFLKDNEITVCPACPVNPAYSSMPAGMPRR